MYPLDRRSQAIHIHTLGHSIRKIALLLNVSSSTVHRWLNNPIPKTYTRKLPSKASLIVDSIKAALINNPFLSCRKLQHMLQEVFKFPLSHELVRTAIIKSGMTKKKAKYFSQPSGLAIKTKDFLHLREHFKAQNAYFVSVDETSFGRNGIETKGYAPKGKLLVLKKPRPTMQSTSVLAIVSQSGVVNWQQKVGAFDTNSFHNFLFNTHLPSGTVILLDNVSFHHSKIIESLAVQKGWKLLFVPPYSPWFNPIEGAFSIVKRHYYQNLSIEDAMNSLTPAHLNSFFTYSLNITSMPDGT